MDMTFNNALKFVKKNYTTIKHFEWDTGSLRIVMPEETYTVHELDPVTAAKLLYHAFFTPGSLIMSAESKMRNESYCKFGRPNIPALDRGLIREHLLKNLQC
mgnify:CR=1 FL=1